MKKLAFLILALMGQCALAQDAPYDGEWNCNGYHTPDNILRVCYPFCKNQGFGFTVIPGQMECPNSEEGTPGDDVDRCAAILNQTPPLCCPPGTVCARAEQPAPTSSSSSGGGGGGNKALIAGGAVIAGVALYHVLSPSLPEGFTLEPTAHVAYRDGFPSSSFALRGSYGNWSVSAFSAHTGERWSPPRARAQWQWVWDF